MSRQYGDVYMIQRGQMPDAPIIVTFRALPIMLEKTKPWHFAVFMKIPLKMAQHIALHICNHSLLKDGICPYL